MATTSDTIDFLDPPQSEGEMGRLGPYRVTELIGLGGMGQVFRAEDTRLKRTVALKVMNRKFSATPHSRKRFVEEARSMAAVYHDNVATIFEVGQQKKTPFMAMELLKGATLEQLVTGGRKFSYQEIIEIAKQTALGLDAAHERGIVHRDIKPANLWMQSPQERIKILDFGLALAGTGVDELSAVGSVVGSLGYLAPEQASNEPVDERTDLYALGVVMYELCAGKLPLLGRNVSSQLVTIITQEPVPLSEVDVNVPEPLARLITQLLIKDPGQRPPTATRLYEQLVEVAHEIEHGQQKQLEIDLGTSDSGKASRTKSASKSGSRKGVPTPIAVEAPDADDAESDDELTLDEEGSNFLKYLAITTGFLALIAIVAYFAWQPRRVAQTVTDRNLGTSTALPATTGGGGPPASKAPSNAPAASTNITTDALKPLKLTLGNAGKPATTKQGDYAVFEVRIVNQADSVNSDPRALFQRAPTVARIEYHVEKDGKRINENFGFPRKLGAKLIPTPGSVDGAPISIQLPTNALNPGDYQVVFELQTPSGGFVTQTEAGLKIINSK
ncbi:serine/threonine-protein kinase [Neorhodopirellula pilleata]|uniref:Serine/threonine-protein kinase PknB n=1 Tax=Neorhodopirellula pilleata TaxID=2714738 RepID=A0A5C5ZQL0_9BACT|nr:serine/threonine-protein kinase [Neorhodopirellula pilleata]TWT89550.1 Serine/threonine-protein kinase PknB [Neorhodopirellula pilleata]